MMRALALLVSMMLVSCTFDTSDGDRAPNGARERGAAETPPVVQRAPAHEETHRAEAAPAPGPRTFGAPIDGDRPLTPLASIVGAPGDHAEQIVRTRGVVHRVCQRMGCWMELREGDGPPVRVPMAGHAFYLPRDCEGQRAEVEGRVMLQELSPEARAHLGSEGATALASTVSINATGVRLGE